MSDKKHIDRLFREKFKDFEIAPREEVWEQIEAKLNKKKKKQRLIPIWWRYAGVAASLALMLTIGSLYFRKDDSNMQNQVVEESASEIQEKDSDASNEFENSEDITPTSDNGIANTNESTSNNFDPSSAKANTSQEKINNALKDLNNSLYEKTSIANSRNNKSSNSNRESSDSKIIVGSSNNLNGNIESANNIQKPKASENPSDSSQILNSNTGVADITKNIKYAIANNDSSDGNLKQNKKRADGITLNSENNSENIINITDNLEEELKKDILKKDDLTIEKAIAEAKNIDEEEKFNRWSIAPNAAPVYFNSFGKGSSIDPQFNANNKSGDINMSYGIKASYAVNNRLKIRSGVNKVNMGYNTKDVIAFQAFAPSFNSSPLTILRNIKSNFNVETANSTSFISSENIQSKNATNLLASVESTSLNQQFGFIEVPLEIQYNLFNRKFGLNIIGGFSSLFLNENSIYSESSSASIYVGEASNINKVSYSANFGLGLNYKVSKMFDLNLEPIFKYQINTFENTSGNFNPYFIGVYTGFAIKF